MKILIIDDSVVMRKIVESALRRAGLEVAQVLHAANGLEGLAELERIAARGESFDLILCDVHMPVMDGPGFLIEKPRLNLAPGVPVVMITADASDPHLLQAIAAGAQGYISKPFTLAQMHTRVASSADHGIGIPPAPTYGCSGAGITAETRGALSRPTRTRESNG